MARQPVAIRSCHTIEEFEAMVDLEIEVWGFGQRDVVPSQMYVVAAKTGGQVFGAFVGNKLVGFALAYPGIRDGLPYLHSHMAGVLPEISRPRHWPQAEVGAARGCARARRQPDRMDVRPAASKERVLQHLSARCGLPALPARCVRLHEQSTTCRAAHRSPGCRVASVIASGRRDSRRQTAWEAGTGRTGRGSARRKFSRERDRSARVGPGEIPRALCQGLRGHLV